MGLGTHVLEFAPGLMSAQLDDGGGAMLRGMIEELGVAVHTGKNTLRIVAGDSARLPHGVRRRRCARDRPGGVLRGHPARGTNWPAAAAWRSANAAASSSTSVARTSDANIFAIGECALRNDRVFGLVAPGYEMAKVAAGVLGGRRTPLSTART